MNSDEKKTLFEKHIPFTVVSNQLVQNKNLSLKAKGLACFMSSMPDDWNFSIKNLMRDTNEGQTAIVNALKELLQQGYLERTDYKDERGYNASKYDLYLVPRVENPHVENPTVENQHTYKETANNKENNIYMQPPKKPRASKPFVPPTLEEVQAYIDSRHSSVDAKFFCEYFGAGNWIDSQGKPVKNWKQKLITWERGNFGGKQQPQVQQTHYQDIGGFDECQADNNCLDDLSEL